MVIFRNLPYLFMKSKAKVVVVGGGVVGVSMLYHLAKKGWSDVVLVERKELTSGSTWHAAGLLPLFNMSYSVGQLHKYAVNLYKTLEKETGKRDQQGRNARLVARGLHLARISKYCLACFLNSTGNCWTYFWMTRLRLLRSTELLDIRVLETASPRGVVEE